MVCTNDPSGPEGGAAFDISQICYDSSTSELSSSWDGAAIWTGSASSNNCVLYDTDGDGRKNRALCFSISSSASGAVFNSGYPATFTCSDNKVNRCSNAVGPTALSASSCSIAVQNTDPFSGANTPEDLRVTCSLDGSDFGGTVPTPTANCTFNNTNPGSAPVDCIAYSGTPSPSVTIAKSASPATYNAVGDNISYSYLIQNTGNVIFDTISVTDDLIATVDCSALPAYGLTPNQTMTCTASYTIQSGEPQAGSVTNIAYATGNATDSAPDSATVTYDGPPFPELSATKSVEVWDPAVIGLYAVPGNDVIYTISITNSGDGVTTADSLVLIDDMPGDVEFYNGDIDDGGPETEPVSFVQSGAGLTFSYATDVAYSNSGTAPTDFASCTYSPSAGYDPNVTYICINPGGSVAAGDPDPSFAFSFRARIL